VALKKTNNADAIVIIAIDLDELAIEPSPPGPNVLCMAEIHKFFSRNYSNYSSFDQPPMSLALTIKLTAANK